MSEAATSDVVSEEPRVVNRRDLLTRSRRSSLNANLSSSFRMLLADAASAQADTGRSIGGRLGGSSSRRVSLDSSLDLSSSRRPKRPLERVHEDLPAEEGDLPSDERVGSTPIRRLSSFIPQKIHRQMPCINNPSAASPPFAMWIVPALSCAAAFASYNIFIKKGSATIDPILGGVILQVVAAFVGTALLGLLMLVNGNEFQIQYDRSGLFWSCMAGLSVGTAEIISFWLSGIGVSATQSIPIIIGGSVVFGAVLGVVALGEKFMLLGWCGVALLVTGVAFVALDFSKADEGVGGSSHETLTGADGPPAYWVIIGLACALAYAIYNIFIKKGSVSINPVLGGVVLQSTAAIFGSVLILITIIRNGGTSSLEFDRAGLFWSCMAGLAVGLAEILSFCISGMGVNATQSIPIIIGGSIVIGTVLGLLMLGETIMWSGWLGISFLVSGIWLVVIDPGQNSSTTTTERAMRSYCCFWKRTSGNHPPSATLHTEIDGTTGHTDSSVQPCGDTENGIIAEPETTTCILHLSSKVS